MKDTNQNFIKILLLAVFILLVYYWAIYHISSEIVNLVGGAIATFSVIISFIMKYREKGESDNFKDVFSSWLSAVLNYQIIVILFISFFVISSFISSVKITTNESTTDQLIQLYKPSNQKKAFAKLSFSNGKSIVTKTLFTNPFGRSVLIDASGYQKSTFSVPPWTGLRINIEDDLRVSPTLVFRYTDVHSIVSRLKLKVKLNEVEIFNENTTGQATFILGNNAEIPDVYYNSWFIETKAEFGVNDQAIYQRMNNWWVVDPLFIPRDLSQGDEINVEIYAGNGVLLEKGLIILNSKEFQELKLKTP